MTNRRARPWTIHKLLVARDGRSVRAFPTATEPEAPVLVRALDAALEGRSLV